MTAISDIIGRLLPKGPRPNKYLPHQGKRECERRLAQQASVELKRARRANRKLLGDATARDVDAAFQELTDALADIGLEGIELGELEGEDEQ